MATTVFAINKKQQDHEKVETMAHDFEIGLKM
jgi:hypothetical protein